LEAVPRFIPPLITSQPRRLFIRLAGYSKYDDSDVGTKEIEYQLDSSLSIWVEEDASGQPLPVKDVDYLYDVFGQLIGREASYPSASDKFEYYVNERGQRVLTIEPYGDPGQTDYRVTNRKLWDQAVDQLLASEAYNHGNTPTYHETFWPLTDHQGTVRDIYSSNSSGDSVEHTKYDTFGRPDLVHSNGPAKWYVDSFHAGREYDEDTGLYYNRARWYDPVAIR
jgi:hypothetical protein